jgi:hypothetical protein
MNNLDRIDVQFLHYCLKNKLQGEALVYLYYRRKAVDTCGITLREREVCGIKYRQQLRYLNSLQSLGWVELLPNNKIRVVSIRRLRKGLGIFSRQVVELDSYAFTSLSKFKTYCFSILTESVAKVQNKVVRRKAARGVKYGSDGRIFPDRNKQHSASDVLTRGIAHYKNQLSLRLIAEQLDIPKSTADKYKKQAISDGRIAKSTQLIFLKSKQDAHALSHHGFFPRVIGGRFCIMVADELHFPPSSIGKRHRNNYGCSQKEQCPQRHTNVMDRVSLFSDYSNRRTLVEFFSNTQTVTS